MKLASEKTGEPDGRLLVVSRDLSRAIPAEGIASTLQAALENWEDVAPRLESLYGALIEGRISGAIPFEELRLASPLPRAYQWADGSAYVNHVELVRRARGATMPEHFWTDPLMYQGGSDAFVGPCDPIEVADEKYGIDFESEIAVVTDRVAMGTQASAAGNQIRLFMLVNDVSLRNLIPEELAKGFGFFHSKPASAFSPVAITPDELGDAWDEHRVHLPLISELNGSPFGRPEAGEDMTFDFPTLVAHAAKTRRLEAGTIIGSGTVSNRDRSRGSSCIAEKRMLEILERGEAETDFMAFGDRIRIEMRDREGHSLFGAIEQKVVRYQGAQ